MADHRCFARGGWNGKLGGVVQFGRDGSVYRYFPMELAEWEGGLKTAACRGCLFNAELRNKLGKGHEKLAEFPAAELLSRFEEPDH